MRRPLIIYDFATAHFLIYEENFILICHRSQLYHGKFSAVINDTGGKLTPVSKNLSSVNSTTQRCPNKIIKTFLTDDFFHLPPLSMTPVVQLEQHLREFANFLIWP
jgi:hypothetical protein